jgi:predicted AlkP superfamily phosphohydrolase/phosphomutase
MTKRVLAVGLDGATWRILEPLARRGVMPRLAALLERGVRGDLLSTVPPVTAPAWTSFLTGKNPGKHGIYQFFSLNPLSADSLGMGQKSYLAIPGIVVNSGKIPGDKLWNLISRAGLSQVTLNLPMAWPPEEVRGIMVTGMLTPPGSPRTTWPPELAGRLAGYEIDLDPAEKDFSGDNRRFLARVAAILEARAAWSLRLLREEPWDFFMTVFTESDRLQHRFYDLLDPATAGQAPPERRELIPLLEDLYRRMDTALGELVDAAGEATSLIVVSDHGFGPAPTDLVDLRVLGALLGLTPPLSPPRGPGLPSPLRRFRLTKARAYKYLGFLPGGLLEGMEGFLRRRRLRRQPAILFKMHENVGGVWVSLRDDRGRITDPAARERLMADLTARLGRVTWRGRPLVSRVAAREELYHGPFLDGAPDLVFVLHEEFGILEPDMAPPPGEVVVAVSPDRPRKRGTHRMEGVYLLAGPAIRSGVAGPPLAMEDSTALILYLLGLPLPDDLDGRVPEFPFNAGHLSADPVRRVSAAAGTGATLSAYDPEEERAIKERLEGIGYLD